MSGWMATATLLNQWRDRLEIERYLAQQNVLAVTREDEIAERNERNTRRWRERMQRDPLRDATPRVTPWTSLLAPPFLAGDNESRAELHRQAAESLNQPKDTP